jgi:hypothetical protein
MSSTNSISTALNALIGFQRPKELDQPQGPDQFDHNGPGVGERNQSTSAFELDIPASLLQSIEETVKALETSGKLDLSPDGVRELAHQVKNQLRGSGFSIANARPDSIQGLLRL